MAGVEGLDAALAFKAPLDSPTFTGTVDLPATTNVEFNNVALSTILAAKQNIADMYDEVILDNREIIDGNAVAVSNGNLATSTNVGCTSYIDCLNAMFLEISVSVLTTTPTVGIAFYNSSKVFISSIPRPQGASNGRQIIEATIPEGAAYFRATYWNFANSVTYGDFYCKIRYPKGFLGLGKFRPFQTGRINYRVKVNQSVPDVFGTANTLQDSYNYKGSAGTLVLPDNYSKDGNPTKAIMFCHGGHRNVSYTEWGSNDANYLAQKERWRALGYAVFDVNGQRDNSGNYIYTIGTPQAVSAYRKAFEYITQYYNIDPEIYVIGASMGGAVALNYCFTFSNVRALALLSAYTDLLICGWNNVPRNQFVEYYGFTDMVTYEPAKVQGYDPSSRILTIGDDDILPTVKFPMRLWIGALENGTYDLYPVALAFIAAAKLGGNVAEVRILDGVGHETTNGGCEVSDGEVGMWFSKF